ncbi:uncharacterized protein N7477_002852 [Penicillium maclennaniae]|uniref:uncharacterized protein n=1 Tax=Penicillium maclennaniae TaxID=1343394 RepID=UPI002540D589|nr:uncharacterized protein N7477_002852 [Penicillium maclennaniae]KAJ5677219.1 hypothetical protein N7477_002852 [Penicillium maclennaniae]
MLRESDIDSLNNHLASLSVENKKHNENLQHLLDQFQSLLADYSSLQSDYEEVKEGREKYKRQARGQERNPFVLVLVDGDGYLFKEHFLKAGSEGGIDAARELSDSVKELMHSTMGSQADNCRIMVRVYANMLGLSKVLARAGFVGHEARSIAPFVSGFNRAEGLFDFVDAADKKEGSDFKIREMFRMFVDFNQCRHIYFAGCHDTGFNSLLTPHRGSDKITLIKAASWHRDFENYGLPIKELPSVFMSASLSTSVKPTGPLSVKTANTINGANGHNTNTNTYSSKPVCKHFQKGICRFGNTCIKQHIMPEQELSKPTLESPKKLWTTPTIGKESQDLIPINKDGDRLDVYCPHPSADAMDRYHRRAKESKVCNSYHLSGECGDMSCPYDHGDVSDTIIDVLKYLSLSSTHVLEAELPNCKAVKSWQCRFNHRAHTLDLHTEKWVASVEQTNDENSRSPSISDESVGDTSSQSFNYL